MALKSIIPVPKDPDQDKQEDKRLWIGNLDPRITEFKLLKLLQKFGAIEKFDLLFHKTGPLAGQPRGYAFVTYAERCHAVAMMEAVSGKLLGNKQVAIRWAHTMTKTEMEKPKVEIKIPALIGAKEENKLSRSAQIRAIESKLKMMERSSSVDHLMLSEEPSTSSCSNVYDKRTKKDPLNKRNTSYLQNEMRRKNFHF